MPFGVDDIYTKNISLSVDTSRRLLIQRNHSATHLLHAFLRKVLGDHVEQKGSFVGPDYLRFDFSHFKKIEDSCLREIETSINDVIVKGLKLEEFNNMPILEAKKMGAMSLFGEKYGDRVRVIKFGDSIELCGGTHVSQISEIGLFKIISESSIASGVRRIEAVTSQAAINVFNDKLSILNDVQQSLKNNDNIVSSIQKLIAENKKLNDIVNVVKKQKGEVLAQDLGNKISIVNGVKVLFSQLEVDVATLKNTCFSFIQNYDNIFLALVTKHENKIILNIALSKKLVQDRKLNAADIINQVGKHIDARGGGQPFFAVASGKHLNGVSNLFDEIQKIIKES
tara:strand:- start:1317 stop:2336 length:1020 start_codon:yes stop_codon:yes gene_type:complete